MHEQCHHQIVDRKLSVSNITLPPYTRRIWCCDKANVVAIMKRIEMFQWREHLDNITCPNEQVQLLNEVLLNIHFNFILNRVKTIRLRQVPWITPTVKKFLRNKCRTYKSFVGNGQPDDKRESIQNITAEGSLKMQNEINFLRQEKPLLALEPLAKRIGP